MGQVQHGSATTIAAVRRAIQHSQESLRALAKRYGLNPKMVAKWRKRATTADAPMGPKAPRSTVLRVTEEAIIVAFRQKTLLALDDVLGCLRETIPHLTRSSLHRCLQRRGVSRLPQIEGDKPPKTKFKSHPLGYLHIDIGELQTAEGKLRFVAIDRTSKFAYVELHQEAGKMVAAQFMRHVIEAVPYAIHTVLTDNGVQFTNHARHKYDGLHIFDRVCDENGVEHKLTKVNHPWTNGQVERMNRTIKDARSSASTMILTNAYGGACGTSSTSPTSDAGSRPSRALRPTNSSVNHGLQNQIVSPSIRSIKSLD